MGYNLLINGVYRGYNPLILTFDPNFQRDIQVKISQPCDTVESFDGRLLRGVMSMFGLIQN